MLSAITPQLAGFATSEDYAGLAERLRFGLRQSLVIIIPCTLVMVILAQPIAGIFLKHLSVVRHHSAGTVIAILAAGLPGFTIFQLCVRGLQALQRAREIFFLYVFENALTIGLCVLLGRNSIAGLTASVSISYTAAAALAVFSLARHQVSITSAVWSLHVRRSLRASLAATLVMAVVYAAPTWNHGVGLILRFSLAMALGTLTYVGFVMISHQAVTRKTMKNARLGQF